MKIVNVNALIIRDNKLLLAREKGHKLYLLPGGGVEKGESLEEALCRELKEELGVNVTRNDISRFEEFSGPTQGRKFVRVMHVFKVDLKEKPRPSGEVEELRWVSLSGSAALSLEWIFKHRIIQKLQTEKIMF